MIFLTIFIVELFLLFFLSRFLIRSVSRFLYGISKSRGFTVNVLAILFLPGTIVHELAHMLVAGLLLVPVGEIDILPKMDEDGVRLGSVQIAQTDMLRRLIIGVAPVILGLGIIFSVLFIFKDIFSGTAPLWQTILALYMIFEIANSMFSSKKDMEGAVAFLVAIIIVTLVVLIGLFLTNHFPSFEWLGKINNFSGFFKRVDIFLLVPLGINIFIWVLSRPFKVLFRGL